MFAAGLPLHRSLAVLGASTPHAGLSSALGRVCAQLDRGSSLSKALAEFPHYFPSLAVQLIHVGEQSGGLHLMLVRVADYLEEENRLVLRLRAALTYPLIVLGISLLVLLVVPAFLFQPLQAAMQGQPIPWPTRAVMSASALLRNPLGWLLLLTAGVLAVHGLGRIPAEKRDRWLLRNRLLGPALRQHAVALSMLALESLYESGVPILRALPLAGQGSQNRALQADMELARQAMEQGASLTEALRQYELMPGVYLHLMAAGEESGKLGQAMKQVARMAREDVEHRLEVALAALEPLALLAMGALVGTICLATLRPLMALLESVAL